MSLRPAWAIQRDPVSKVSKPKISKEKTEHYQQKELRF
jgi:hypothetical protein